MEVQHSSLSACYLGIDPLGMMSPGREDSQLAALWFLAKIFHSYYRNVPTEVPFEKSLAMMSLIGMPGSGTRFRTAGI